MLTAIFFFVAAVTSISLFFSLKKNIQLLDKLQEMDDVVSSSLEILEQSLESIEAKTKIEVFSDDPVVKDLVQDMTSARNAVRLVVQVLEDISQNENQEQENSET